MLFFPPFIIKRNVKLPKQSHETRPKIPLVQELTTLAIAYIHCTLM